MPMLLFIRGKASDRKLRLFAVGCCRRVMNLITRKAHRKAIVVCERFVDGLADDDECTAAFERLDQDDTTPGMAHLLEEDAFGAAYWSIQGCGHLICFQPGVDNGGELEALERGVQSHLLRCIFGNPFRPVSFSPAWRTGTALALARQMYDSREFGALPILADALQDAGCDNADILSHCSGLGPHVRGCWVVDLVLGKE
jgi:hypothetical protein